MSEILSTSTVKAGKELDPLLVDLPTAARLLGLGRTCFLELVATGRIPCGVKLGRRHLWSRQELSEWSAAGSPSVEKWQALRRGVK